MTGVLNDKTNSRLNGAELVGGLFLVWAFVWDNARQRLGDATNPTFALPIPRGTRFVEVFALGALLVYVLLVHRQAAASWVSGTTLLLLGVLVTLCGSVVGVAGGYTTTLAALNTGYAYLSPLVLAAVLSALGRKRSDGTFLLTVFLGLVILNSVVAWYQLGIQHEWGDAVHGAMHDAHMYANVAWLGVLLVLARLYYTRLSWWWPAVLLLLFVPTAWAAQHEMAAFAFSGVVAAGVFVLLWRRGLRWRLAVVSAYGVITVVLLSQVQSGASFLSGLGRLEVVARNLPSLGIVKGYLATPSALISTPQGLLVGTGPGSYGSAGAIQPVLTGGKPSPLVMRYTAESYEVNEATRGFLGSFTQSSTDLTAFLVEFGPFVSFCCALTLWLLVAAPAIVATSSATLSQRIAGLWVIASLAFLLLLSAGTAFYGWAVAHTSSFAVVAVGALLLRERALRPTGAGPQAVSSP